MDPFQTQQKSLSPGMKSVMISVRSVLMALFSGLLKRDVAPKSDASLIRELILALQLDIAYLTLDLRGLYREIIRSVEIRSTSRRDESEVVVKNYLVIIPFTNNYFKYEFQK